jgi:hypothetical protein
MSKGRAFATKATKATKNAILRFVARGLIARQNDLCRAGIEAARNCKNDR